MTHSVPRATLRVLLFLTMTGVLLPPYLVTYPLGGRARRAFQKVYFAGCCRLCRIAVVTVGVPAHGSRLLYVANHVSYLDVPILGKLLDAVFVAKSEVAGWPFFGFLARIARAEFVDRSAGQALAQRDRLARRLAGGDNMALFPEGTSSDGTGVLPFKSALFAVAIAAVEGRPPTVQPVSIAYVRLRDGTPLTPTTRRLFAWFGDMDLVPHLWTVLGLRGAVVEVRFHDPVTADRFPSRKAMATHCHAEVARGLTTALATAASTAPPPRRRLWRRRSAA